jgi:hypothetical protein
MKQFYFKGYAETETGVTICVNVKGNAEEYAKAFLAIWNNGREYPDTIKKVENTFDNRVYVTVREEAEERAKEFLAQFGEIKSAEKCDVFTICAEYPDSNKFYDEDKDGDPVFLFEI